MKKQNWVWTLSALAVLASPLATNTITKSLDHSIYRTIASVEAQESSLPHLERAQDEQAKDETVQEAQERQTVVVQLIKLTVNDPAHLKKLNDEINTEKLKGEDLQKQLSVALDELSLTKSSDSAKALKIAEIEKAVDAHVARITELEGVVAGLEGEKKISQEELAATKLALDAAKVSADEAAKSLEEANLKLAQKDEELKAKEAALVDAAEETKKKDEALKLKGEELESKSAELKEKTAQHDLYVCQSEEKFSVLGKQIEDLNKQQQQFTQVMLGLNQLLLSLVTQMQGMNQQQPQVLGLQPQGYFGQAYAQNPYALGQQQSPSVMMGNFPFNPWMQQQQAQPSVINNYYSSPAQTPYFMQQGQNPIPGSFNFGMPAMNDQSRAVFGGFQDMSGQPMVTQMPSAPILMPN